MAICASCGSEGDGKFCGTCGARMPEPARDFARPTPSTFATRVAGPLPVGSTITVGAGDVFYGVRYGTCEATLEKGAHVLDSELDFGWFILKDGVDVRFDEDLGVVTDNHGQKGKLVLRGNVRLKIDEPRDFAASHEQDLDMPSLSLRVREKLKELMDAEIRDFLARDRYLTSLQSSKAVDVIKKEVLATWTGDADRDTFLAIELPRVEVRVIVITDAPPPPEPEPIVPPGSFAAGARVDVVWTDGQRYPATVRASGCLVRFDDGQEHWIPSESLAEAAKTE